MDDATLAALIRAAGLEETAREFPDDVRDALATVARQRAALPRSSHPRLEPTPGYLAPRR
ncbi:hypothetical protein EJV46_18120 [Roseococcus sp. SYP-B2431]|uniref:hypothetical protein n=1 Tax=Roseococcus sp. SYP-B2431 TaxID=2496640 RepID=UPI00103E1C25|nr:hypothetical protein [Roseococcus sp. SYP-B2431]TCH97224.1 hypothetical protein EJV46_18120 [Roseococcus sp. SYP-B2431]